MHIVCLASFLCESTTSSNLAAQCCRLNKANCIIAAIASGPIFPLVNLFPFQVSECFEGRDERRPCVLAEP